MHELTASGQSAAVCDLAARRKERQRSGGRLATAPQITGTQLRWPAAPATYSMSRKRGEQPRIPLFTFLDVLICTMGALIVLLSLLIAQAKEHVASTVVAGSNIAGGRRSGGTQAAHRAGRRPAVASQDASGAA